jgi:hypothetical protein
MSLKNIPPKKRQTLLLAGLGVAGAVAILVQFALIPALAGLKSKKEASAHQRTRIQQAETHLKRETQDREQNAAAIRKLRDLLVTVPPETNSNLWVTEQVYRIARISGFTVDSLQETSVPPPAWLQVPKAKPAASDPGKDPSEQEDNAESPESGAAKPPPRSSRYRFGPYRAQGTGVCDYETLKRFFEKLEEEFPLLAVQSLTITVGSEPDRQTVGFTLEWPTYQGIPDGRPPSGVPVDAKP